jgi:hypothetical protein
MSTASILQKRVAFNIDAGTKQPRFAKTTPFGHGWIVWALFLKELQNATAREQTTASALTNFR